MLQQLREERQQITEAILVVERIAAGTRGKRRGRPPKWMAAVEGEAVEAATFGTKRTMSAAARKRISDAQKKRWAAQRRKAT